MDPATSPKTISAQVLASRHLQSLQQMRDEALVTFSALESAPPDTLQQAIESLPKLVKGPTPGVDVLLKNAKVNLLRLYLRRVLQMDSLFLERIFVAPGSTEADARRSPTASEEPASAAAGKNPVALFRDALLQVGSSENPAIAFASLMALEKALAQALSAPRDGGSDTKRANLEFVLMEADGSLDSRSQLAIKPWQQSLVPGQLPPITSRLLDSVFATAIIVAHEAVRTGEQIHGGKEEF